MLRKSVITVLSMLLATGVAMAEQLNRYEVKVDDFTELKIRENININYVSNADSAGMAVFYATEAIAPHIVFSNNKGKLTVEFANKNNKPVNPPTVTVYSRFITLVENQSDSTITMLKVNSGPQLKLRIMGNGKLIADNLDALDVSASITTGCGTIVASGNCGTANLTNLGSGIIQADNLNAKHVKCKLYGTGTIGCTPSESLTISGAGSGKVFYFGKPKSIENSSIGVKLIAPNEE
ncbi:MAG: DUF2807 domain-containing protein [Muribaculaceae bacterium]|nr:DUF2807 domain-containing protein [Muribaculaceae bacterium]